LPTLGVVKLMRENRAKLNCQGALFPPRTVRIDAEHDPMISHRKAVYIPSFDGTVCRGYDHINLVDGNRRNDIAKRCSQIPDDFIEAARRELRAGVKRNEPDAHGQPPPG